MRENCPCPSMDVVSWIGKVSTLEGHLPSSISGSRDYLSNLSVEIRVTLDRESLAQTIWFEVPTREGTDDRDVVCQKLPCNRSCQKIFDVVRLTRFSEEEGVEGMGRCRLHREIGVAKICCVGYGDRDDGDKSHKRTQNDDKMDRKGKAGARRAGPVFPRLSMMETARFNLLTRRNYCGPMPLSDEI
ncbi:hypothetical protein L484_025340 [Morus notabilis]|uniref:Uncharacterized protein n=1 Tax=Morus notabilis TaxID=981085 RepID=W9R242_9ROSA|nr:hypothetical protein L484_025340 [Morus notabilis]